MLWQGREVTPKRGKLSYCLVVDTMLFYSTTGVAAIVYYAIAAVLLGCAILIGGGKVVLG